MDRDSDLLKSWFVNPDFYFDTAYPDTSSYRELDYFLSYSTSRLGFVELSSIGEVGLFDIILCDGNGNGEIELQFTNQKYWNEIGNETLEKLVDIFFNTFGVTRLEKMIYEFDESANAFFKNSFFEYNGSYRSLIYKNRKYWDVFHYSIDIDGFKNRGDKNG